MCRASALEIMVGGKSCYLPVRKNILNSLLNIILTKAKIRTRATWATPHNTLYGKYTYAAV